MKTINKMKTMKTVFILAAFLGLQFSTIFAAGNYSDSSASLSSAIIFNLSESLAPVAPKEATFEDAAVMKDGAPALELNNQVLAPITPAEADFEEVIDGNTINIDALAPVTPVSVDFEDHI
jgi:hypothetical protein